MQINTWPNWEFTRPKNNMADVTNSKLLKIDAGILDVQDACVVLVKTEWNSGIVDELERVCVEELHKNKIKKIVCLTVPGAVEIPFAVLSYLESVTKKKRPDAFIALGCVIKGDTPHFDYVCKMITEGVLQLNLSLPMPTIFGVLTVDDEEQAKERTGGRHGHKGREAAITALKMISLNRSFKK
jgi:6,7-dimethyl-8-ribityllumazine synthase